MKRITIKDPDDRHLHLKRLMKVKDITAGDLAKMANISYYSLLSALSGKREFKESEIESISNAMGIMDVRKYFLRGIR